MSAPYIHKATVSTAAGAASSASLRVNGGIWRHLIVRANTANTTLFRVTVDDENDVTLRHYGYHEGDLNDTQIAIPVVGVLTVRISSSSAAETYTIRVGVEA
jgi:hypothetical protein